MEALANVNQFGFCELREDELREVDGGYSLNEFVVDSLSIVGTITGGVVGTAGGPIGTAAGAAVGNVVGREIGEAIVEGAGETTFDGGLVGDISSYL